MNFMLYRIIVKFFLMSCVGCLIILMLKIYFRGEGKEKERSMGGIESWRGGRRKLVDEFGLYR